MKLSPSQKIEILKKGNNRCARCNCQGLAFGYRTPDGVFHPTSGDDFHNKKSLGYRMVRIELQVMESRSFLLGYRVLCGRCVKLTEKELENKPQVEQLKLFK